MQPFCRNGGYGGEKAARAGDHIITGPQLPVGGQQE